jgi:hypothetical protein
MKESFYQKMDKSMVCLLDLFTCVFNFVCVLGVRCVQMCACFCVCVCVVSTFCCNKHNQSSVLQLFG